MRLHSLNAHLSQVQSTKVSVRKIEIVKKANNPTSDMTCVNVALIDDRLFSYVLKGYLENALKINTHGVNRVNAQFAAVLRSSEADVVVLVAQVEPSCS